MISRIYRSLLTIGLTSLFLFTLVFGTVVENSWAMESTKAATKDLERKTQAAISNVTDDAKNQIIDKAKQAEAKSRKVTENIKDGAKLPERVKANVENLESKAQEAFGNLIGDRQDQIAGKAKQLESKTRNLMEDAKDKVKDILE